MGILERLPDEQTRAWCAYLGAFHTAHTAMGNTVALPISPKCTRRRLPDDTGCGTCYRCTEQIIQRALFTAIPVNGHVKVPDQAWHINNAVFSYVTALDPQRLCDDHGDDYPPMTSEQFARVMNWAATFVLRTAPAPLPRTYGAHAAAR